MTRVHIDINDDLVQVIMKRFGAQTTTEVVELALRHMAGQPTVRAEALAMRGAHAFGEVEDSLVLEFG